MRRVLVTGASSGIGEALVAVCAARGDTVLATGRRARDAVSLPAGIAYVSADLAEDGAVDMISQAWGDGPIDLLIANAGTGYARPIEEEDAGAIAGVVAVNLAAPIRLAHGFAARLAAARGTLVLVGSVAHKGAAKMPVYAATKAGLDGFARALNAEWRGRVDVVAIHPGPTRTGMLDRSGYRHPRLTNDALQTVFLTPETVARLILRKAARRPSSRWRATSGHVAAALDRLRLR